MHKLKLDDVPNTIDNEDLGGAPHAADVTFRSDGRGNEASGHFIFWPAHVGEKRVNVRISTKELSRVSGVPFEIDSDKINGALQKYRALIERRANDLLIEGTSEVTLDLGSLNGRPA
jgi:hypothetical protein